MNSRRFPAGNRQVPGGFGAAAQNHGIEFLRERLRGYIHAHVGIHPEFHAFFFHKSDPTGNHLFVQLHIGDAEHHQSSGAALPLKHRHLVAPVVQLVGNRQAGGARTYHRYPFSAAHRRDPWNHPAVLKAGFDHSQLVVIYRHTVPVHAAGTGRLTQRGADPPGKLREIIGFGKPGQGLPPVAVVDLVIPLRDQVVQGAAAVSAAEIDPGLAERHTAVHAPRRLNSPLPGFQTGMELFKVPDPFQRVIRWIDFTGVFQKTGRFSHCVSLLNPF